MSGREIDRIRGEQPGPTLLIVGGIHGNEPAGVTAAREVLARARAGARPVRGEVIALIGNRPALAAGRRYLVRDLNRQWLPERIAAARALLAERGMNEADAETIELVELAGAIDEVIVRARGPVYVLDLHTTSADGTPFSVVGEGAEARAFAAAFPLPGLLGLEGTLPGVLTPHLATRGCITLAIEGGQSQSETAVQCLQAAIAIGLATSGVLAAADVPDLEGARALLTRTRGELPPMIDVVSRHPIEPGDDFVMEPGFPNISRTVAGTLLAHDRQGEIRAPFDGLLVLPLYQPQGSDGFFYGRAAGSRGG